MKEFFVILLTAIIIENFVLQQFLGICPFLGVSKKIRNALGMGMAVILIMVSATAITWPIYKYILVPNGIEYLKTIVFILIIALFVQLVEMAIKKTFPPLYKSLGVYLPLITTNCAVLGIALVNVQNNYNIVETLINGTGAGVGFTLAIVLFAGIRERLELADIPESFQGYPITLISAALMSIAFLGFTGLIQL